MDNITNRWVIGEELAGDEIQARVHNSANDGVYLELITGFSTFNLYIDELEALVKLAPQMIEEIYHQLAESNKRIYEEANHG